MKSEKLKMNNYCSVGADLIIEQAMVWRLRFDYRKHEVQRRNLKALDTENKR